MILNYAFTIVSVYFNGNQNLYIKASFNSFRLMTIKDELLFDFLVGFCNLVLTKLPTIQI